MKLGTDRGRRSPKRAIEAVAQGAPWVAPKVFGVGAGDSERPRSVEPYGPVALHAADRDIGKLNRFIDRHHDPQRRPLTGAGVGFPLPDLAFEDLIHGYAVWIVPRANCEELLAG